MKHSYTHPTRWRLVAECHEIQSSRSRAIAQTERKDPPKPTPEKKQEPQWRNLTLAELKVCLANAEREEGITD